MPMQQMESRGFKAFQNRKNLIRIVYRVYAVQLLVKFQPLYLTHPHLHIGCSLVLLQHTCAASHPCNAWTVLCLQEEPTLLMHKPDKA